MFLIGYEELQVLSYEYHRDQLNSSWRIEVRSHTLITMLETDLSVLLIPSISSELSKLDKPFTWTL